MLRKHLGRRICYITNQFPDVSLEDKVVAEEEGNVRFHKLPSPVQLSHESWGLEDIKQKKLKRIAVTEQKEE